MSKENKLPCVLCNSCLRLLKKCIKFKNGCKNANKILTQLLIEDSGINYEKFNIEELHNERRKQFDDIYSLAFTQIFNFECIDQNLTNRSSRSKINTHEELNQKVLPVKNTDEKFIDDPVSLTEQFYFTGNTNNFHSKNSQNNSSNNISHFYSNNLDRNNLSIYLACNEEESFIKREIDDCVSNSLNNVDKYEEVHRSVLPEIKNEFNIDNELLTDDIYGDTGISDNDFNEKCIKMDLKLKSKKKINVCGNRTELKTFKRSKLNTKRKKKSEVIVRDVNECKEKKTRVSFFHFDETAVIVDKLTVEEQFRSLETARSRTEYIEAPFKCDPCAKYFLHELSLQGHVTQRHEEAAGEYMCMICTQRYSTAQNLRNHNIVHEERLQCKQCSQVVCGRGSMAKHIAGHNGFCPKYKCEICGKMTASKRNLKRHINLIHTCPTIAKKYKCPYCPRTFSLTSGRNDHATRAHTTGDRYFPCNICDKTFLNKTCLRIHSITHSEKKEFYCVECDKNFKRQSTLDNHLKVSTRHGNYAFLKYKCDQCDKRYDTAVKLKAHVDCTHLQLLNWTCDKCPSKFLSRSGLSLHRRKVHEGKVRPKNHVCSMCGKGFTCKFQLDKHIRVHTGELPFSCDICERPFRQKSTLETHIKLVHLKLKRQFGKSKPENIDKNMADTGLSVIENETG